MKEIAHKRVEFAANIGIVVVSSLLTFTLVRDTLFKRTASAADRPAANLPRGPELGHKVMLPNVNFANAKQTLVFVLSKGCRFCTDSAEFYRKITHEHLGRTDLQLLAVLPQDVSTAREYLNELGVPVTDVIQASLDTLNI